MPDDRIKISALPSALSLDNTDVLAIVQGMTGDNKETKKAAVTLIAAHLLETMQHNNLDTSDKTIIGAINEVAETLEGLYPVADASGPIANFETALARPLEALKIGIVATQEAGTPTPAIPLPISGWSEVDIARTGKNLFDEVMELGKYDNNGEKATANNQLRTANFIMVKPSTSYYMFVPYTSTIAGFAVLNFYDKDKTFISKQNVVSNGITITTPNNACFITFFVSSSYGTTYNNDIAFNYPSTETGFNAYAGNTETINLGGTYYGGYVEVDKDGHRQLVVTHDITDLGDLTWGYSVWGAGSVFAANIPLAKDQTVSSEKGDIICSIYNNVTTNEMYNSNPNYSMCLNRTNVRIANSDYSNKDTFKTAMSGIMLVYPLAEPIIIDLPDGVPIETLIGVNNIFADSGDILECKYKDTIQHYIDTQIAATQALIL